MQEEGSEGVLPVPEPPPPSGTVKMTTFLLYVTDECGDRCPCAGPCDTGWKTFASFFFKKKRKSLFIKSFWTPLRLGCTEGVASPSHLIWVTTTMCGNWWTAEIDDNSTGIQNINKQSANCFSYRDNVRCLSTWIMERNQQKVFNGSGPPAQSLLQDPGGAIYHLFQIVVHGAGNIEDKGQGWRAVIGSILHIRPGDGKKPLLTDTERQHQAF